MWKRKRLKNNRFHIPAYSQGCKIDEFLFELKFEFTKNLQVRVSVLYFQFFESEFGFGRKDRVYRVRVFSSGLDLNQDRQTKGQDFEITALRPV